MELAYGFTVGGCNVLLSASCPKGSSEEAQETNCEDMSIQINIKFDHLQPLCALGPNLCLCDQLKGAAWTKSAIDLPIRFCLLGAAWLLLGLL